MARNSELSPAKTLLLAVQLTSKSDINTLRALVSQYPKTLRTELVLRILLTHLPETLDSDDYVPLLKDLVSENPVVDPRQISSALEELSEEDAKHKARKLHLLHLPWPHHPSDIPRDPLVQYLIHRALLIDEHTGLVAQIPGLVTPFLDRSLYLRTWMISTVLPFLRLNYEYYPEHARTLTISQFEHLDDRAGLALLLSKTGQTAGPDGQDSTVGRDLRGLVGPWMYGDTRWKCRKLPLPRYSEGGTPLDECLLHHHHHKYAGWEEVFKWIVDQAGTSWRTVVAAIEQWDGPGDVDYGAYEDGKTWIIEEDEQHLEMLYGRSILAAGYLISEASLEALDGVNRILSRLITLMDKGMIPSLQQAATLLLPVSDFDKDLLSPKNILFLRNHSLDDQNILTKPTESSVELLHALLISAFLCTRTGFKLNVKRAGELTFLQDEHDQKAEFAKFVLQVSNGPKGDDKYWIKMRSEILWLRSWGAEELPYGRGVFGRLPKEFIEAEILKLFLANARYTLARSIYETSLDQPLSKEIMEEKVISAAMNAYDNATNANRTRGGVKKCDDILHAFPDTLTGSLSAEQYEHLIKVTHDVGQYRLVFKQGEPFKPVTLRVHSDPLSIIGKILDQNPKSYSKLADFIDMGGDMVKAGLNFPDTARKSTIHKADLEGQISIAERRVVSMCIDAALAEDDFETAYSYVVTHLKDIGGPAHLRSPEPDRKGQGLFAEIPPTIMDDWSWRAALQAGKYRRTSHTIKPTHLGNASGNPEIRHLEQRMECLSQALRLAPKTTLQEILNVYRRCEEELESQSKQEAEQEEAWDSQGDQAMPGGFQATPIKNATPKASSHGTEEAPMSLFDLSRASMARAHNGFSSLSILRGSNTTQPKPRPTSIGSESMESSRTSTPDSGEPKNMRKRDKLKNAAVGGLASGIGWLINAPPPAPANKFNEQQDERR